MEEIKLHLFNKGDSLKSISNQYKCPLKDLYLLNPLLKFHAPTIGQLIYVKIFKPQLRQIKNDSQLNTILKDISSLNKECFISYINKFNDFSLIENDLLEKYQELSQKIFTNDSNAIEVFTSQLKNLHQLLLSFIDVLITKNEDEINKKKKEINESLINISKYFDSQNIHYNIKELTKIIESRMIMIAKLINNNYYDARNLL